MGSHTPPFTERSNELRPVPSIGILFSNFASIKKAAWLSSHAALEEVRRRSRTSSLRRSHCLLYTDEFFCQYELMKKNTSWGNVADWYFSYLKDEDNYQSQVIAPNLLRVMNIQEGEHILDLACGTGFFSELFHAQGGKVVGVDIGKELIELARTHASKDITFFVSSADSLKDIASYSIDKIACILAIQNIQEVKKVFEECRRVLKDSGKLYVVLNHPAYRIPGGSSWGFDEKDGRQYRRIDEYLSEKKIEIAMHPGKNPSAKTVSFHRPIQYYSKVAYNAAFALLRLEEWISHKKSEQGPRQKAEDRIRKEIPLFMVLEFGKLSKADKQK